MIGKKVFKILLYIVSLTVLYMLLLDFTPPSYPILLIPPFIVGIIAGFVSWRKLDLVVLSLIPIPLYYIAFLLSIDRVYTLNKVLATGPILYIPILYHLFLAFSTAILIYNVKMLFGGWGGSAEESGSSQGAVAQEG